VKRVNSWVGEGETHCEFHVNFNIYLVKDMNVSSRVCSNIMPPLSLINTLSWIHKRLYQICMNQN